MGQGHSHCRGSGKKLLQLCEQGDTAAVRTLLATSPETSTYSTCIERNSALLVAAGKGHARMVQAILEAAVLSQGLTRAKKRCINHSNSKGQSALMLACISGHAQCVEVLVCNGASPLVLDNARHNSALHWAASCCRADCVGRLLGSGAIFQMQSGQLVAIADIPCFDEDNSTLVKFVDRHNGWGLTALQLATHKGSSSTVRALLRHGASVSARSVAPSISITPALQPPGSTALHFAAAAEDVSLVLVLLEAQVSRNEPDLRRAPNNHGDRPIDLARSSSNPLLHQLLDPSHALSLHPGPRSGLVLNPGSSMSRVVTREGLRQHQALLGLSTGGTVRGSRRSEQAPHLTLVGLLQRLKLVLSLEAFALQQQLAAAGSNGGSAAVVSSLLLKQQQAKEQQVLATAIGDDSRDDVIGTAPATNADVTKGSAASSVATARGRADNAAAAGVIGGFDSGLHAPTNGVDISPQPEIRPTAARGRLSDDTHPLPDSSQQQQPEQQRHSTAQVAAQQVRLRVLQQLMATVDELLAMLPASAAVAFGDSSPGENSSPPRASQHQQHGSTERSMAAPAGTGGSAADDAGAGSGNASWGLLGGLLSRSSTEGHVMTPQQQHLLQQQQHYRLFGTTRSSGGRHTDGSSSDHTPAAVGRIPEDVLASHITPSLLSSLAAVIKLLVGASSLSGQHEQQLLGSSGGCGSSARWAEQEHALVLMRGILKTARTALEAAQQAAAAAASRSALRQRHQQQLASLLGSDSRPVHSSSLRRALLGERLADQGQIRFGSSSSSRGSRHDSSSVTAAYLGGGIGMSWGMDAPLGVPAAANSPPGRHQPSSRRRHRERSRRHAHGEEAAGTDAAQDSSSRRHHRHQSRHHRSGRRRTPRAVDLPMDDLSTPPATLSTLSDLVLSTPSQHTAAMAASSAFTAPSSRSDGHMPGHWDTTASTAAGSAPAAAAVADSSSGRGYSADVTPEQQHQRYLQQLAGILNQHSSSSPAGHASMHAGEIKACVHAGGAQGVDLGAAGTDGAGVGVEGGDAVLPASSSSSGSSGSSQSETEQVDVGEVEVSLVGADADVSGDADSGSDSETAAAAGSCSSLDATTCAICMDCTAGVSVSRCSHSLCLRCAYQLCYKAKGLPLCPFCRQPIDGFDAAAPAAVGYGC